MAGGTFKASQAKVRPGTFVNLKNGRQQNASSSARGTAMIPLIGYDWGPKGEFFVISADSPDGQMAKLGRSIYDSSNKHMLMLQLMLAGAATIYVYVPEGNGKKAQKETTLPLPAAVETEFDTAVTAKIKETLGVKAEQAGCNLTYDKRTKTYGVILAGPISGVSNTGIADTVEALIAEGYTVTAGGVEVTDLESIQKAPFYNDLGLLKKGGPDYNIPVVVSKDNDSQAYTVCVSYPTEAPSVKNELKDVTASETKITAEAMYTGTLGNSVQIVSVANPVSGYDVSVLVNGTEVELFEKAESIADIASDYVTIKATAGLTEISSLTLEGGSDGDGANAGITRFLDVAERIHFNTMAFPTTDASLQTALLTKIRYIRENIGWKCQAVVPNFKANYEGIINLINGFEYDGIRLEATEACAWLAGATAGADYTTSLTYAVVTGATAVVGELSNEASEEAIKAGQTYFSVGDGGEVILEYDINSLTTLTDDKPAAANKNRPMRVYDTWCNDLLMTFVPGRYDNDEDGWIVMEGLGRALLKAYEEDGAVTNVDLENDFVIDRAKSIGDSTYINSGLQAVDSADKYYITTITR